MIPGKVAFSNSIDASSEPKKDCITPATPHAKIEKLDGYSGTVGVYSFKRGFTFANAVALGNHTGSPSVFGLSSASPDLIAVSGLQL